MPQKRSTTMGLETCSVITNGHRSNVNNILERKNIQLLLPEKNPSMLSAYIF